MITISPFIPVLVLPPHFPPTPPLSTSPAPTLECQGGPGHSRPFHCQTLVHAGQSRLLVVTGQDSPPPRLRSSGTPASPPPLVTPSPPPSPRPPAATAELRFHLSLLKTTVEVWAGLLKHRACVLIHNCLARLGFSFQLAGMKAQISQL